MPQFNFTTAICAPYIFEDNAVSYGDTMDMGGTMTADLDLKFAEGRLYSRGGLSRYRKKVTSGSISIGVDKIPDATQKSLFDLKERIRTVGSAQAKSMSASADMNARYHGVGLIAPDAGDDKDEYTAVFVHKSMFGPPSMSFKTLDGNTIVFATPTTVGEFMKSDAEGLDLVEWLNFDTEEEAKAWLNACFGKNA